jgi:hypothetical protein
MLTEIRAGWYQNSTLARKDPLSCRDLLTPCPATKWEQPYPICSTVAVTNVHNALLPKRFQTHRHQQQDQGTLL